MAATVTSNYGGEFLETILVRLSTGNPTVSNGHIRIHANVNSKLSVPRIKASDVIKDYKATPVAGDSGTIAFDENEVLTGSYMLYARYDPENFASFWKPFQPEGSAFVFQELPESVQMSIMEEFLRIASEHLETIIYQGDSGLSSPNTNRFFDGAFAIAAANADVIDVSTPITLTSANIEGEMDRTFLLIPQAVKANPNCKWFMSYTDWYKFGKAQIDKTYKGINAHDEPPRSYRGITIVPTVGVPEGKFLICVASAGMDSNFHFAIKFMNDFDAIKTGKVANDSEEEFIKMAFKAGVVFGFGEEVVAYNA